MMKYDYFEALESMAICAVKAVESSCGERASSEKETFSHIRAEANKTLISLQKALFLDFLPPLGREDIASLAHVLSGITDAAHTHATLSSALGTSRRRSEEERICITLAEELKSCVNMLRKLKKNDKLPELEKIRELLHSGAEAHSADIARIYSGSLPQKRLDVVLSAGRLRTAISHALDTLIEVMLSNI